MKPGAPARLLVVDGQHVRRDDRLPAVRAVVTDVEAVRPNPFDAALRPPRLALATCSCLAPTFRVGIG